MKQKVVEWDSVELEHCKKVVEWDSLHDVRVKSLCEAREKCDIFLSGAACICRDICVCICICIRATVGGGVCVYACTYMRMCSIRTSFCI